MPLDFALGIFAAIIISRIAGLPLDWQLVALGIIFSVLPDVDFAFYIFRKRQLDEFAHEHRDLTHNPLIFIPVGFIIIAFWSFPIAWLFAALSFWHFLHDSIPEGGGWGIRWLYPFSKKYYKFFSSSDGKFSAQQFVASWTRAEQRDAAIQYGDPNWVRHYLRREFIFELFILIIAVGMLIIIH